MRIATTITSAATSYSEYIHQGRLCEIRYVKTDFANGSTITITGEVTGTPILAETGINADATRRPRGATCDIVGAASLYAAGGEPVEDKIVIVNERIKIVVTAGGTGKTGTLHFTFE